MCGPGLNRVCTLCISTELSLLLMLKKISDEPASPEAMAWRLGEEAPQGEEALARRHVRALVCVARAIRAQCRRLRRCLLVSALGGRQQGGTPDLKGQLPPTFPGDPASEPRAESWVLAASARACTWECRRPSFITFSSFWVWVPRAEIWGAGHPNIDKPLCRVVEMPLPGSVGCEPQMPLAGFLYPYPPLHRTCWGLKKPLDFGWGHSQAWGPAGGLAVLISKGGLGKPSLPVFTTGGLVGGTHGPGWIPWFPCTSCWGVLGCSFRSWAYG